MKRSNGKSRKIHIDKRIPLPARTHGRPQVYMVLSDMKIGNSIGMAQFSAKNINTFRTGIYGYVKRKHPKWRMSVMKSDRANDGGARVWRVR